MCRLWQFSTARSKTPLVWISKYLKLVLAREVAQSLKEIFLGIAGRYELEIDTLKIMPVHVHLFLSAPPKYSPSRIVQILKRISARELFKRHPEDGGVIVGRRTVE